MLTRPKEQYYTPGINLYSSRLLETRLPFSPFRLGLASGQFPRSAASPGTSSRGGFRFPSQIAGFAFLQKH
jgi:hypothetical protein